MQAWHLEISTLSHGSWKAFHGHEQKIFADLGEILKDLVKRKFCILYIFILEKKAIFIEVKAVGVPCEFF